MYECCEDLTNRTEPEELSDDLVFTRCTVCDRRHFELTVDPGLVGVKGSEL